MNIPVNECSFSNSDVQLHIFSVVKSVWICTFSFLRILSFPDLLLYVCVFVCVFVCAFVCPGGCSLGSAALHWVCQEISWTPQWSGLLKTLFTQGDLFKVTERHKVCAYLCVRVCYSWHLHMQVCFRCDKNKMCKCWIADSVTPRHIWYLI